VISRPTARLETSSTVGTGSPGNRSLGHWVNGFGRVSVTDPASDPVYGDTVDAVVSGVNWNKKSGGGEGARLQPVVAWRLPPSG